VTHDQEEAMAISDRVGVMNQGRLEQIDTPDTLYNKPANDFVASFVGTMNHLPAQLENGTIELFGKKFPTQKSGNESGKVNALIRPESIKVSFDETSANAVVLTRSFLGANSRLICRTNDGTIVHSLMSNEYSQELHPGEKVKLEILSKEIMVANA
jgi:putative spermidine/putrescine transport system ATP-binding protein